MALSMDDKLLGEKTHYYCSSSEDEGSDADSGDEGGKQAKVKEPTFIPEPKLQEYSGSCTNTGPKGVINDWREFKRMETEQRENQEQERKRLMNKLQMTCRYNEHRQRELGGLGDVEIISLNPQDPNLEILAEYRKLHPHGTIPCLAVEGRHPIVESGAICLYLADLYDCLGPEQNTEDYYNWIVYCAATLDDVMEHLFVQWVFTDLQDQDTELINKMVLKFHAFTKYLTSTLQDREYICGNRFTAADCVLGYNLWWAMAMRDGVLIQNCPTIQQYYQRLSRRSAFQRVMLDNGAS